MEQIFVGEAPREKRITNMWAVVAADPRTGGEGLCAMGVGIMNPCVCTEERLVPYLREQARMLAKESGKDCKVVKFRAVEIVETFRPAENAAPV